MSTKVRANSFARARMITGRNSSAYGSNIHMVSPRWMTWSAQLWNVTPLAEAGRADDASVRLQGPRRDPCRCLVVVGCGEDLARRVEGARVETRHTPAADLLADVGQQISSLADPGITQPSPQPRTPVAHETDAQDERQTGHGDGEKPLAIGDIGDRFGRTI
jgi:hypothetical protein